MNKKAAYFNVSRFSGTLLAQPLGLSGTPHTGFREQKPRIGPWSYWLGKSVTRARVFNKSYLTAEQQTSCGQV